MRANYQSGTVADASADALFITLAIKAGQELRCREGLARAQECIQALQTRFSGQALHGVIAIGSEAWDRLWPERPARLVAFPSLTSMPDTPVDLLLHLRSNRRDVTFELAKALMALLADSVEIVEEVSGFRYLDMRDLTGFVDGTENPDGDHRKEVVLVGDEDPAFAGGAYIHMQRYEHDLTKWEKEPLKQQEDTYGRTKAENIEYPGNEKPLTAHTKRTSLKDEAGNSREIFRLSMPYGGQDKAGLVFISYCRVPDNFNLMLQSMVEGDGAGHTDRLMNFTQAKTGHAFFAPPLDWFEQLQAS